MIIYKAYPESEPALVYVGKTNDLKRRQQEHRWSRNSNKQTTLSRYISQNPEANIIFEELESCSDDIAAEREDYWCREIGSLNKITKIIRTEQEKASYELVYRENHREQNRLYSQTRREKADHVDCPCGHKVKEYNYTRHCKTKYHLKHLS